MQTNRVRILGTALLLAVVGLVAIASTSQAQPYVADQPGGSAQPESVTAAGSMGVEWITDWPGTADDRANWYYSANNLYNELKNNAGWAAKFNWGQTNAWERDWKAFSSGGNGLVDTVDLAMIGTHGTGAWDSRWKKNLSAGSSAPARPTATMAPTTWSGWPLIRVVCCATTAGPTGTRRSTGCTRCWALPIPCTSSIPATAGNGATSCRKRGGGSLATGPRP
jgi:hypothetical protein